MLFGVMLLRRLRSRIFSLPIGQLVLFLLQQLVDHRDLPRVRLGGQKLFEVSDVRLKNEIRHGLVLPLTLEPGVHHFAAELLAKIIEQFFVWPRDLQAVSLPLAGAPQTDQCRRVSVVDH